MTKGTERREAVARLVDPNAWATIDEIRAVATRWSTFEREDIQQHVAEMRVQIAQFSESSLSRADEIDKLYAPLVSSEEASQSQPGYDGESAASVSAEPSAAFTPGPWHLCHHLRSLEDDAACPCGYRGGIWGSDEEHIICEMGGADHPGEEGLSPARYDRQTELANARLIAAAPDAMAALVQAVEAEEWRRDNGERYIQRTITVGRAAIAKALVASTARLPDSPSVSQDEPAPNPPEGTPE